MMDFFHILKLEENPVFFLILPVNNFASSSFWSRPLGINPSKSSKFSLRSLIFSYLMSSSFHLSASFFLAISYNSLSLSYVYNCNLSCHNLSTSFLCSNSRALRFYAVICSNFSSSANFLSKCCLNSCSILCSCSFTLYLYSLCSASACCISIFCLSFFWRSALSFYLSFSSYSSLWSS